MSNPVLEFYEKPGCVNNRKQKALLLAAGFSLNGHNIVTHPWQVSDLKTYFEGLPLPQWFNPSAPSIKQELIKPFRLSETQALQQMVKDPLLIRRPLISCGKKRQAHTDEGTTGGCKP